MVLLPRKNTEQGIDIPLEAVCKCLHRRGAETQSNAEKIVGDPLTSAFEAERSAFGGGNANRFIEITKKVPLLQDFSFLGLSLRANLQSVSPSAFHEPFS